MPYIVCRSEAEEATYREKLLNDIRKRSGRRLRTLSRLPAWTISIADGYDDAGLDVFVSTYLDDQALALFLDHMAMANTARKSCADFYIAVYLTGGAA